MHTVKHPLIQPLIDQRPPLSEANKQRLLDYRARQIAHKVTGKAPKLKLLGAYK